MKRKYRKILVFFIALIMLCIITLLVVKFFHGLKKPQNVSVVDTIKNYDYALEDRDTVLYKNLYQQLKEVLEEDKIDEDAYSKLVVQMFIADLFTLDNKMSKYDVCLS